MASRKFRFVSPGVFLKEIDNSQLPGTAPAIGPVLIGRTRRGPAMSPVKVQSLEEFDRIFGAPMPGNEGRDPWREGTDLLAESYLPYAARAHLAAGTDAPVTVIRLAGVHHKEATEAIPASVPGWTAGCAHGLFIFPWKQNKKDINLELAAIFYGKESDFDIKLDGSNLSGDSAQYNLGTPVKLSAAGRLGITLKQGTTTKSVQVLLSELRNEFNTNPVATNEEVLLPSVSSLAGKYWLGETFEDSIRQTESSKGDDETLCAVVLKLDDALADYKSEKHGLSEGRTGWFFANADMINEGFDPFQQQKLFRFVARHGGLEASKNILVAIEDIRIPRASDINRFGSFSVVVRKISNVGVDVIERFDNCNLDPSSQNFISKKIGDQYMVWSDEQKVNRMFETNENISDYIRVELHPDFDPAGIPEKVPFGFLGPIRPLSKRVTVDDASTTAHDFGDDEQDWVATDLALGDGGLTTVSLSYPDFPLVPTASADDGYLLGTTPFVRNFLNGHPTTAANAINSGYIDHVRRMSSLDALTLVGDQDDGTATEGRNEHVYAFTLDEVVIETVGNLDAMEIERTTQVDKVYYESGTKLRTQAKATVTFDTDEGVLADLQSIVMFDAEGTKLEIKVITNNADGAPVPNGTTLDPGVYFMQRSGLGDSSDIATRFAEVVEIARAAGAIKISADAVGGVVTLTQDIFGSLGNDRVLTSGVNGTSINDGPFVLDAASVFSGGRGKQAPQDASFSSLAVTGGHALEKLRVLTRIVKGFQAPLVGGFDGTNITEANPFNNRVFKDDNGDDLSPSLSYAFASVSRAIDMIKDPEILEHNLASMPGITNSSLTTKLVRTCEARADSLAIIDLEDVYVPPSQKRCTSFADRLRTTPQKSADALADRQLNSSYGATYYPWVKIRDELATRDVWVPPSVVALGVMAYTEARDDVWFAPAGFNRGGLNQGNAGIPVLQTSEHLLSKDRDALYEANINPIASFVSEGIVIFGQKTLQSTQSALDRINVRRLLIYVKKFVSIASANLLFEQNLQVTWNRFLTAVVPELQRIQQRFGLSDFKVILDETTTTPDLVDRNILYAKIFLKPARSIEFIAVDFIISRTGAEFADPLG